MSQTNPFPVEPVIQADDPQAEVKKLRYQAWLDVLMAEKLAKLEVKNLESAQDHDRILLAENHDNTYEAKLLDGYIAVASSQIERSIGRAQAVQTAATALGSAYTAILAFVFALPGTEGQRFPVGGIATTVFAAFAIFCSTAFIAFVTDPQKVKIQSIGGGLYGKQHNVRNTFILWTRKASGMQRRRWLQASVMFLGASVLFLPVAFIDIDNALVFWLAFFTLVCNMIALIFLHFMDSD